MPQFFPSSQRASYRSAAIKCVLIVLVMVCVSAFWGWLWKPAPSDIARASNVSLDASGAIKNPSGPAELATSTGQFAYQREVEQHLARKAEDLLEGVLGVGRAVVRVTAEMRFQQPHETRQVDPIRAPLMLDEQGTKASVAQPSSEVTSTEKGHSFQPSTTTIASSKRDADESSGEQPYQHIATIERLSVAVMLIATKAAEGDRVAESLAVSLPDIEAIVRQAVGFKAGRDAIQVSLGAPLSGRSVGTSWGAMATPSLLGGLYLLATVLVGLAFLVLAIHYIRQEGRRLSVEARSTATNTTEDLSDLSGIAATLRQSPEAESTVHANDKPLKALRQIAPLVLARVLADEHPRAVAIALHHMELRQAIEVLKRLGSEVRRDIFLLMAHRTPTHSKLVQQVLAAIVEACGQRTDIDLVADTESQIEHLIGILHGVDRTERSQWLAALASTDPEAFNDIDARLYDFADLLTLADVSLERLLAEIDLKVLATALTGASPATYVGVMGNVSQRVRSMLQEEIEFLSGVNAAQVAQARREICDVIRQYDNAGRLVWKLP